MSKKEELKNRLINYLENYKSQKEGWQKVKRVYKKDGSEFKNRNANFEGARFGQYEHIETELTPYLTINYTFNKINDYGTNKEYRTDHLKCYQDERDLTEEEKKTKKLISRPYSYDVYILSYEEIEEKIKEYINILEEKIKSLEEQIKNFDNIMLFAETIKENVKEFIKENKNVFFEEITLTNGKKFKDNSNILYYAFSEYLQELMTNYELTYK